MKKLVSKVRNFDNTDNILFEFFSAQLRTSVV